MSRSTTGTTARAIVDDVLGRGMTRDIWTGNYDRALPVSVQDFDLTAVLPAVFYMFRFGHRRGRGKFLEIFGGDGKTLREKKRVPLGHARPGFLLDMHVLGSSWVPLGFLLDMHVRRPFSPNRVRR